MRETCKRVAILAVGVTGFAVPCMAQDNYPNRLVKIVNPYVAGSTTDILPAPSRPDCRAS